MATQCHDLPHVYMYTVPDQPKVSVDNITNSSISISWSVPSDSVVTSYEVVWTSNKCPTDESSASGSGDEASGSGGSAAYDAGSGVDEGSGNITDTSYTIEGLREGTTYNIAVAATNSAGTSSSDTVTAETLESSEWSTEYVYMCDIVQCI